MSITTSREGNNRLVIGGLSDVPIVEIIITYDCKRSHQTYLLVVRNVLYILKTCQFGATVYYKGGWTECRRQTSKPELVTKMITRFKIGSER